MSNAAEMPWARVRQPVAIPAPVNVGALLALPNDEFAFLLRCHLVPRDAQGPGKRAWSDLWGVLRADQDLSDRAFAVLNGFLDAVEDAESSAVLVAPEASRVKKFGNQVEMAMDRLARREPLGWAGKKALRHPAHSREVIAILISAIARHRARTLAGPGAPSEYDRDLWATMRRLGFDPRDYDTVELPDD